MLLAFLVQGREQNRGCIEKVQIKLQQILLMSSHEHPFIDLFLISFCSPECELQNAFRLLIAPEISTISMRPLPDDFQMDKEKQLLCNKIMCQSESHAEGSYFKKKFSYQEESHQEQLVKLCKPVLYLASVIPWNAEETFTNQFSHWLYFITEWFGCLRPSRQPRLTTFFLLFRPVEGLSFRGHLVVRGPSGSSILPLAFVPYM